MATDQMVVARSVESLRDLVGGWHAAGQSVGLVPTMGALHEGHLSLVRTARSECGRVVASLFVNPKQFGPTEDFGAYPRDEAADLANFRAAGVDGVFAPPVAAMYPPGFATNIHVGGVSEGLCGAQRPGHFDGVATVVAKLLLQSQADTAYFGEKDYQQLMVVRQLVRDLDIPVRIAGVPILRDADGLALSSRNAYLSASERRTAPLLYRVLRETAAALQLDPDAVATALASGIAALQAGGFAPEYLELRDAETLAPLPRLSGSARLLAAARLGRTRLIDNIAVTGPG